MKKIAFVALLIVASVALLIAATQFIVRSLNSKPKQDKTQAMLGSNVTFKSKLDKWSWLPKSRKYDAEAAQIPKGAKISFFVPEDDPIDTKSEGWGGIDSKGDFIPTDKKSLVVKGGTLVSKIGGIEKRAKWGDWDFIYADAAHMKNIGWGYSLTSGEILLPKKIFLDPPPDMFVENSFEIETFGDDFVLIHLNATKKHRLCFMKSGSSQVPTAGYIGTKAEVEGRILERKADGWYSGTQRLSD